MIVLLHTHHASSVLLFSVHRISLLLFCFSYLIISSSSLCSSPLIIFFLCSFPYSSVFLLFSLSLLLSSSDPLFLFRFQYLFHLLISFYLPKKHNSSMFFSSHYLLHSSFSPSMFPNLLFSHYLFSFPFYSSFLLPVLLLSTDYLLSVLLLFSPLHFTPLLFSHYLLSTFFFSSSLHFTILLSSLFYFSPLIISPSFHFTLLLFSVLLLFSPLCFTFVLLLVPLRSTPLLSSPLYFTPLLSFPLCFTSLLSSPLLYISLLFSPLLSPYYLLYSYTPVLLCPPVFFSSPLIF